MLKKIYDFIKITPLTLAVIFVLLVITDVGLRYYWAEYYQEPGRTRLLNQEPATLRALRDEVNSAEGYKILFLGDSAVYGSAVKEPAQTIPAYLEQELNNSLTGRQVKVFNFAFKGYGMSENYFILNSLADAGIDLVVYNVSTGWFNREKVLEHTNVLLLGSEFYRPDLIAKTGVATSTDQRKKFDNQVDQVLGQIWKLYRTRSAITTLILGKPLRGVLTDWQLALTDPAVLSRRNKEEAKIFQPWDQKDWSEDMMKMDYKIGTVNLNGGNPQVIFYNLILDLLSAKRITGLCYTSPQNFLMLSRYNKLDRKAWDTSLVRLRSITQRPGIVYTDYSNLVPDSYFTDTIHLNGPGNLMVAKQLARDISKELAGELGKSGVMVKQ